MRQARRVAAQQERGYQSCVLSLRIADVPFSCVILSLPSLLELGGPEGGKEEMAQDQELGATHSTYSDWKRGFSFSTCQPSIHTIPSHPPHPTLPPLPRLPPRLTFLHHFRLALQVFVDLLEGTQDLGLLDGAAHAGHAAAATTTDDLWVSVLLYV